jgi:membrane-bound ClpP family serine protease
VIQINYLDFIISLNTLQALLLITGVIFLMIEIFNPGFGIPGLIGFILLVVGIIISAKTLTEALILVVIVIVVLGIALLLAIRSASKGRLSKTLVLQDSLNREGGFRSTKDMSLYLNKKGIALTTLRPAGLGEFEGQKLDIVSEGDFIKINTPIEIIKVEGRKIIVKEIK